jgi:hypothetical protein
MFIRQVFIALVVISILGCAGRPLTVAKDRSPESSEKISESKPSKPGPVKDTLDAVSDSISRRTKDSLRLEDVRTEAIQEWSLRVRSSVEPYWVLPKVLVKHKYRSVARIRARRNGDILNITWIEKSRSTVFNNLAAKALKKVKRFPSFPSAVRDSTLEIQYEFMTPGLTPHRHKLVLQQNGGI